MGGYSATCPVCGKWFLLGQAWRDHLRASHGLKINGDGTVTRDGRRYTNLRCVADAQDRVRPLDKEN